MSTMRGLIPSLGAGGSLIGAALCALAVLGGVLAFRGEAPGTAEADTGELRLPAGEVRAATAPGLAWPWQRRAVNGRCSRRLVPGRVAARASRSRRRGQPRRA